MKNFFLLSVLFCFSTTVFAHGYVENPESRAYLCKLKKNTSCGAVEYEPQSLEGPKGFPQNGPKDGEIASAGIQGFNALNAQTPSRWIKNTITHPQLTFKWHLTARHATKKWEYFITKPNWNPSQLLVRDQLVLTPFCEYNEPTHPQTIVTHNCKLPVENKGYHVILAVWSIADTANAFYQVIDVDIK